MLGKIQSSNLKTASGRGYRDGEGRGGGGIVFIRTNWLIMVEGYILGLSRWRSFMNVGLFHTDKKAKADKLII